MIDDDEEWKRLIYKDIQDSSTQLVPSVDQVNMVSYSWVTGRVRLDLCAEAAAPRWEEVSTWWT